MLALIVLCGMIGMGCQRAERDVWDDRLAPLATVNGDVITVGTFLDSYITYLVRSGANDTPLNRYQHLESLFDAYLLSQEAERLGFEQDSAYQAFTERLTKKYVGGRFFETELIEELDPLTEAEIRNGFMRYKTKVAVRHLFFQSEEQAALYHQRLEAGEDFLMLANELYGTQQFDSLAGWLGPISYLTMDDAFAEAAWALEPMDYSTPVASRYGYHIVRVEDRFRTPIITEDEFQAKRSGVSNEMHQRKRRLEGNAWVQSFMADLEYTTNTLAIAQLAERIQTMRATAPDAAAASPVLRYGDEERLDGEALRESLSPETPLVEYTWQGEPGVFTAGDYYRWLNDLSLAEASNRTAASVGRALRNEILAQEGFEASLDRDPKVRDVLTHQQRLYKAQLLRSALRGSEAEPPSDGMLRQRFEDAGMNRLKRFGATYWTFPAADVDAARAIRDDLQAGTVEPQEVARGRRVVADAMEEDDPWRRNVQMAPVDMPVVAKTDEAWYVLLVNAREEERVAFEEKRDELAELMQPLMGQYRMVQQLQQEAAVTLDTTAFKALMDVLSEVPAASP
ncbi:MAG: peptidylprolyl isomerase [Bacteroidota bacterium]